MHTYIHPLVRPVYLLRFFLNTERRRPADTPKQGSTHTYIHTIHFLSYYKRAFCYSNICIHRYLHTCIHTYRGWFPRRSFERWSGTTCPDWSLSWRDSPHRSCWLSALLWYVCMYVHIILLNLPIHTYTYMFAGSAVCHPTAG